MKEESLEKSALKRNLLAEGLQLRRQQKALKSLEEGKASFLKATEMAGLSVLDFADLVREKGIVWVGSEKFVRKDIEKALQIVRIKRVCLI